MTNRVRRLLVLSLAVPSLTCVMVWTVSWAAPADSTAIPRDMVPIEQGQYLSLFKQEGTNQEVSVPAFYLDKYQVTNAEYLEFTERFDQWSKANIKPIFADKTYMAHFAENDIGEIADQPVVNVSWFAARAYCKAQDKRLPTLDEWEYVARASASDIDGTQSVEYREKILQWYSKPATEQRPNVKDTEPNYWGVHGMHGVVWELVNDFNTALVTGESRGDSTLDNQLFCGAGSASSVDPSDYAAFMRFALRSSYSSNYTLNSLGFRCAKDK